MPTVVLDPLNILCIFRKNLLPNRVKNWPTIVVQYILYPIDGKVSSWMHSKHIEIIKISIFIMGVLHYFFVVSQLIWQWDVQFLIWSHSPYTISVAMVTSHMVRIRWIAYTKPCILCQQTRRILQQSLFENRISPLENVLYTFFQCGKCICCCSPCTSLHFLLILERSGWEKIFVYIYVLI